MEEHFAHGLARGDRLWRRLRWLLLASAILVQGFHQYGFGSLRYGYFNFDKSYQICAAQSLLDGHGLSTPVWNAKDPTHPLRAPLSGWPPGYSLLMAGLIAWLGDVWTATLIVDLASVAIFFVAWLAILERLGAWLSGWVKILVWSVWIFVSNPLMAMTSAEMLAQALFCVAIYFAVACAESQRGGWRAAACGAFAGATAAVRYAYWPLLVVAPAALAAAGLIAGRRKAMLVAAAIAAAVSLVLLAPVACFQIAPRDEENFAVRMLTPKSSRLFWNQLRFPCPFPAAAIGMGDVWYTSSQRFRIVASCSEYRAGWVVSVPVLVLAAWTLLRQRRRPKPDAPSENLAAASVFGVAGLLTVLGTLALLAYLSLRVPGMAVPYFPGGICTFVNEDRYFAVFFAFVVVATASSLVLMLHRTRPRWMRTLAIVLLACWLGTGAYTRLWRMKAYLSDSRGWRTSRSLICSDTRAVRAAVRKNVDAGQTVLFLRREDSSAALNCSRAAFMAGACWIAKESAARVPTEAKGPGILLFLLLPADVAPTESPAWKLARLAQSRPLDRLECGTLYELVLPAKGPHPASR